MLHTMKMGMSFVSCSRSYVGHVIIVPRWQKAFCRAKDRVLQVGSFRDKNGFVFIYSVRAVL